MRKISALAPGSEIIVTDDRNRIEQTLDCVKIAAGCPYRSDSDQRLRGFHAVPISEHIIAL
ncbi:MAG: hypothetical protein EXR62_01450 [Chloroflexi bacterium]|nr:hypothetical protein [Chloroflexota bacterium]